MIPKINQSVVPKVKREYMGKEMPFVFLVLMVCRACGKNEMVVQDAAIKLTIVMLLSMGIY